MRVWFTQQDENSFTFFEIRQRGTNTNRRTQVSENSRKSHIYNTMQHAFKTQQLFKQNA